MNIKQNEETESSSKSRRKTIVDPDKFIPAESCKEMKKQFNASRAWKAFADIYQNGIYWKPVLVEKQNGVCPVCGRKLTNRDVLVGSSIHHLSYKFQCVQKNTDAILVPYITSNSQEPVFKKTPNCAICKYKDHDSYAKCKSYLLLFHRDCHSIVHDKK